MTGLTSARALVAGLVREGVGDLVVSPGSRSALLAIAADARADARVTVHLDERSAGFFAVGLASAARRPVALICTSGSAAANYLPAVVEAHHRGIPLVVVTADRPPELRDWGAGQTIDQIGLYGRHVRWFAELPVAGEAGPGWFERTGRRAVAVASGIRPGPVHLNAPFRDPLHPDGEVEPTAEHFSAPSARTRGADAADIDLLVALAERPRGMLVVGPADLDAHAAVAIRRFSAKTGWPVIADVGSGVLPGDGAAVLGSGDHLFAHRPDSIDVIVRIGPAPTSKALNTWMADRPADEVVLVGDGGRWDEPSFTFTAALDAAPGALFDVATTRVDESADRTWSDHWRSISAAADTARRSALADGVFGEPEIAATVGRAMGHDGVLWLSSSMPIRDADTFLAIGDRPGRVLANRGANGIDGIVSSALGAAAADVGPVVALLGDLALLHDLGGLLAGPRLGLSATFVVPNNDGGGIFSLLPIADSLPADSFGRLFHAPHGVDLAAIGAFPGINHTRVGDADGLVAALHGARSTGGIHVVEVPVDTAVAVRRRRAAMAAVTAATTPP
ncbi:MAG: 2-succinyl-5-enolpyruvyl-6-hydroxy-3-cyclohexene-1-carboxylic-acid synthase [Acidimicrobiales bacterium]